MTFVFGAGLLILLIVLAIPIGFALGLAGIGGLSALLPIDSILALLAPSVYSTMASSLLLPIPMFVLMAEFLACGGVAQDLLLACNRLLRRIRGGMAMACILAGTVHAAATGSSTASAASLARASYPAMRKAGYAPSFAVGTIAIAGTLAVMIPPSIVFVLYGVMTGTSVGSLFVAGMIPGLLTAVGYIITISLVLKLRPQLGPVAGSEAKVAQDQGGGKVWPMVVLVALIIGGLYSGVATPTEISAIGALGALLVSLYCGRMTRHGFLDAVGGTMRITTMIIVIIFGAHIFGYFITFSRFTDEILAFIAQSGWSPTVVMVSIVLIYLMLGMFMDQSAIIILTAPITAPLVVSMGYDPVWWGVVMIKTVEIGLVSPPLGLVTFVVSSTTRTDLKSNFAGVFPFVITELILLALLVAFPQISLWLP